MNPLGLLNKTLRTLKAEHADSAIFKMSLLEYIATLILMIGALVVVVLYIFNSFYMVMKEDVFNNQRTIVDTEANYIHASLMKGIDAAQVLTVAIDKLPNKSREALLDFLLTQTKNYNQSIESSIRNIYVYYNGMFISGDGWVPEIDLKLEERDWYKKAQFSNKPVLTPPYKDLDSGEMVITVSQKLPDGKGVLAIDMSLSIFQKFLKNTVEASISIGMILDQNGFVVASSDSALVGQNYNDNEDLKMSGLANILKTVQMFPESEGLKINLKGQDCLVFGRYVLNEFDVIILLKEREIYDSIQNILVLSIFLAAFVIIIVGAFVTTSFINGVAASRSAREQMKLQAQLQQNFEIIEVLASGYESVILVDAKTGQFSTYSVTGNYVAISKLPNYPVAQKHMIDNFVHPEDRERLYRETTFDVVVEQLKHKKTYSCRYRKCIQDKFFYYEVVFVKNGKQEDSEYSSFVVSMINRDDTVRNEMAYQRELEEAKKKADNANNAKSSFLANMSHEIRTPINAIMGMNEVILRESKEPQTLSYAQDIQDAGRNLLSLINEILDFSKIEAGKIEIVDVKYDPSSLLNDVSNIISVKAKQKALRFDLDIDESIPSKLFGDSMRIEQVMINLLNNAVKYTPSGYIKLSVKKENIEKNKIALLIDVEDSGIGIKEEDVSKLFKSFQRLDLAQNRNIEGTGLGLAITNKLVEQMGGEIKLRSQYGKGSVFSVRLPQVVEDDSPMGDFKERYEQSKKNLTEEKETFVVPNAEILVVDDNMMNLRVAENLLKRSQARVTTCNSGMACLELMKKKKFHLIFLDHMMPGMDGIETLKLSKELQPNMSQDAPIIALTANAISGAKEMYLKEGFSGYLDKPINGDKLDKLMIDFLPKSLVEKSNNTQNIDKNLGLSYCMNDESFLNEMLEVFASESEENMKKLSDAFNAKDWKTYTITAHAVKSTSLTIGAKVLSEMAKEHEFAGKENREEFIVKSFENFMAAYEAVSSEALKMAKG